MPAAQERGRQVPAGVGQLNMSTETTTPEVMVASVQHRGGTTVTLTLETKDRVKADFELGSLAMATLMLTLAPAAKLALAELEKEHPGPGAPAAPDSPEGLEG